ncbi:MAG: DUF4160 domain-containing protein [Chloroflexota bacterium]|nr:DUF4160 domain-containing protein [Chloroflexota bacterium]MDE2884904.1 DUF4160 domain-containing protein [Chloroflexota bacterium]
MPELCRFYGIVIRMFPDDHGPPHFHASYSGSQATVEIDTLFVRNGRLPRRAENLVAEWAALHKEELRQAWERSQRRQPPGRIAPLD